MHRARLIDKCVFVMYGPATCSPLTTLGSSSLRRCSVLLSLKLPAWAVWLLLPITIPLTLVVIVFMMLIILFALIMIGAAQALITSMAWLYSWTPRPHLRRQAQQLCRRVWEVRCVVSQAHVYTLGIAGYRSWYDVEVILESGEETTTISLNQWHRAYNIARSLRVGDRIRLRCALRSQGGFPDRTDYLKIRRLSSAV